MVYLPMNCTLALIMSVKKKTFTFPLASLSPLLNIFLPSLRPSSLPSPRPSSFSLLLFPSPLLFPLRLPLSPSSPCSFPFFSSLPSVASYYVVRVASNALSCLCLCSIGISGCQPYRPLVCEGGHVFPQATLKSKAWPLAHTQTPFLSPSALGRKSVYLERNCTCCLAKAQADCGRQGRRAQ